jgi:hypothetical protein
MLPEPISMRVPRALPKLIRVVDLLRRRRET